MAGRGGRRHPVSPTDGRAYLTKSNEFLHAARASMAVGNHSAAVGNAVHAGILAADAICAVKLQNVWRGEHVQPWLSWSSPVPKASRRRDN